jgi:hypothetical protein
MGYCESTTELQDGVLLNIGLLSYEIDGNDDGDEKILKIKCRGEKNKYFKYLLGKFRSRPIISIGKIIKW